MPPFFAYYILMILGIHIFVMFLIQDHFNRMFKVLMIHMNVSSEKRVIKIEKIFFFHSLLFSVNILIPLYLYHGIACKYIMNHHYQKPIWIMNYNYITSINIIIQNNIFYFDTFWDITMKYILAFSSNFSIITDLAQAHCFDGIVDVQQTLRPKQKCCVSGFMANESLLI